jgi:predicted CXXCH cytochrome family protein
MVSKALPGRTARVGLLAGIGWVWLVAGCSRKDPSQPGADPSNAAEAAPPPFANAAATSNSAFAANRPQVGGPAGYVGSKACRSCHEDQYASWHRSYHRTMTQIPAADTVQADFHDVTLTNEGRRFVLSRDGDAFRVHMERDVAGATKPESLDVPIGLVTGSHHMQVFWVPGDTGNMQIGFPFTWLIPEKRWVPRNSTFVRPPDLVHRSEVWNVVCSRCHATGTEPGVDNAARTMNTQVAELGIACEACHGPGERHAIARRAEPEGSPPPDARTLRAEVVHPRKIDPRRASQICGFCHSMKWWNRNEGWPEHGFHYRPGDDLEATTPIIHPSRVAGTPGLSEFLGRNPDLLRDFFWTDGMIRVSGRDYNGLIESPCYKGGKFSCLSCHSLHESNPDGQLARNRDDNRACIQCHEHFGDAAALTAHTRHTATSSGSQCYNCHMPFTTYGVLKAIRSHQISSPRVSDELATGRPNACNLCHLDKPLNWTADHLERWYRHPRPELSHEQTEVADSVRLALAGDAGQRVLAAWHLGWQPALEISHTNWIAPILGQLIDDPYAAVRLVAERSLRKHTALLGSDYDYTIDPRQRPPERERVCAAWARQPDVAEIPESKASLLLAWPKNLAAQNESFNRWLRLREDRPVRLRE